MRRTSLFAVLVAAVVTAVVTASAQAQPHPQAQSLVGSPGIEYGNTISAGDGVQLYPYDQQDPWLHGHFQRVPSYGGFASFRPYNYRHVFAQTQLAQSWGHAHGMPYSQQFWNRYRGSYLEGNLHSSNQPMMENPQMPGYSRQFYPTQAYPQQQFPIQAHPNNAYPVSAVRPIGYQSHNVFEQPSADARPFETPAPTSAERPVHVFPQRMNNL